MTIPKTTLYFYNNVMLFSFSYYLMWDFDEYSLENKH